VTAGSAAPRRGEYQSSRVMPPRRTSTPRHRSPVRPNAEGVLCHIVPGRERRLRLTPAQRRALADDDGLIALRVIRAVVAARRASVSPGEVPDTFPLVEDFVQSAAARGSHRRLLFRLSRDVSTTSMRGASQAPLRAKASVGKAPHVKVPAGRVRWWETPFAGPEGRPPPHLTRAAAGRMRSLDEYELGIGQAPRRGLSANEFAALPVRSPADEHVTRITQ
jgi:hypothetical protein